MKHAFCTDCGRDRPANSMGRCAVCGKEISERASGISASRQLKHATQSLILPLAGSILLLGGLAACFIWIPLGVSLAASGLGMLGRAALDRFAS